MYISNVTKETLRIIAAFVFSAAVALGERLFYGCEWDNLDCNTPAGIFVALLPVLYIMARSLYILFKNEG